MVSVTLLADSVNSVGDRLTTFEVEVPKYLLGQLAKHRQLSMNFESSRAKPIEKVIDQVMFDPYIPIRFGCAGKGMSPAHYLEGSDDIKAITRWLTARNRAVESARDLALRADGTPFVAKEIVNRLLEPFMKVKGIVSATEWDNFLKLRTADDAQDDINQLAKEIEKLLSTHEPVRQVRHLPLGDSVKEAVERIARVSYGNHRAKSTRPVGELYDQLRDSGHWSPFEHVAYAAAGTTSGNFVGWVQLREVEEDA